MSNKELKKYTPATPLQQAPEKVTEEQTQLTLYHGKATDTMASMNSKDAKIDPITGKATIESGEVKLVIQKFDSLQGTLGVNTHKLLVAGIAKFTAANNYDNKKDVEDRAVNLSVAFSLTEYAKMLGYDVEVHPTATEEEALKEKKRAETKRKEARKIIKRGLLMLQAAALTWEENVKGKPKDFDSIALLSRVSIRGDTITMEFNHHMAAYLLSLPITHFPITQLRIDGRNQNAYTLGNKFATHYNIDNNQKKGTANRLKVAGLLEYTNLPTYEQTVKNRNSWIDRIKEPFEAALDEIVRAGTLANWYYTHAKGVPLTEEEAYNITDFKPFTELYITFEMGEEVDHTARLTRRAEEKKRSAAKKKKIKS